MENAVNTSTHCEKVLVESEHKFFKHESKKKEGKKGPRPQNKTPSPNRGDRSTNFLSIP